ncbi:conserved virulence factor C family protein [Aneurinibacillus migulanus]|uniref:PBS lyase HEAT-like repeat-containing protein n=1 Tax=Aneurinibacillus migulanus TaxID=47500 RepID=A0A0D1XBX8_ANEMI|nr:conserved virulence factor C family protein [Aneurinibacillus migulanus]KIV49828.1 virulence factor [Aneurinibacillus migulanus]KON97181.1 virulence factor [Aneurinibacillus migulanus]MED0894368.1 conserved virulence factor C family protein [Aneurinibacillus migulanus]MED1616452.1 conserved virulence factor C family protein [Aneurinibacillus migulanus]SDK19769.1 PBS lyase HEAT-like repeat-containing protein [Aneurinibacillus migulanus]
MKIVSIEPTPSPNSMKLNLDEQLPMGISHNYTRNSLENAPEHVRKLLDIPGVTGVFQVLDFIALERHPKADWRDILTQARAVLGTTEEYTGEDIASPAEDAYGEVQVFVQMFRGLPMQIKLEAGGEQKRVGLPERFMRAALEAQRSSTNLVMERKWEDRGVRYGTMEEIGEEVAQELSAAYDDERLHQLVEQAFAQEEGVHPQEDSLSGKAVEGMLDNPDWEKRFAALERMNPAEQDVPVLHKALHDTKTSIRRLAVVYLGMIESKDVLPLLFEALKDKSPVVRRTAGDTLSDLGDPAAIGPMMEALEDPNKLVRWRAARFLYEVGDETALPALREAQDDPEFEVSLQVKMALERIEAGEQASGTVWQQMTRSRKEK